MMFVTVILLMCLNVAIPGTCMQVPIVDNAAAQPDGHMVTMGGCLGLEGFETSKQYWEEHPELHDKFQYKGWACQMGNKQAPKKGDA